MYNVNVHVRVVCVGHSVFSVVGNLGAAIDWIEIGKTPHNKFISQTAIQPLVTGSKKGPFYSENYLVIFLAGLGSPVTIFPDNLLLALIIHLLYACIRNLIGAFPMTMNSVLKVQKFIYSLVPHCIWYMRYIK